jgi:hypothetical protein
MLGAGADPTRCSAAGPGEERSEGWWDSEGKGRRIGPLLPEEGSHSAAAGVVGASMLRAVAHLIRCSESGPGVRVKQAGWWEVEAPWIPQQMVA